jgi:hypothetical protein
VVGKLHNPFILCYPINTATAVVVAGGVRTAATDLTIAECNKAATSKAGKSAAADSTRAQVLGAKTASKAVAAASKARPASAKADEGPLPKLTARRGVLATSKLDPEVGPSTGGAG